MFNKILIANRGEIACRVIRTCKRMGIRTVAVYSEADAHAQHVKQADEAFLIGGPRPVDSYLKGDVILAIAKQSGAEAIHPGYGFLSENATFARACEKAGVVFIGPTVDAIEKMGSKSHAKALMQAANVPVVPGFTVTIRMPYFWRANQRRLVIRSSSTQSLVVAVRACGWSKKRKIFRRNWKRPGARPRTRLEMMTY